MKKLDNFGLPVYIDEYNKVVFKEIRPNSKSEKYLSEVTNLLYNPEAAKGKEELAYNFYEGIYKKEDKEKFKSKGYDNGITVLMPVVDNSTGGECRKNSGHYHGINKGHTLPYPEAYEILVGKAVFLLQKSTNFDNENEELELEEVIAVFLNEGEKLVVPPFYAHCAINVGEGPMAFGNLAAKSPLYYEPIQNKHGFSYYLLKEDGQLIFVPNTNYQNIPKLKIAKTRENSDMGIKFSTSLYEEFVKNPDKFEYLSEPEKYEKDILNLLIK